LEHDGTLVTAGGYGGNLDTGKITYDNAVSDLPALVVTRLISSDPFNKDFRGRCYLYNDQVDVLIKGLANVIPDKQFSFPCEKIDPIHNMYWDDSFETTQGGYSPPNDAMYGENVVSHFYNDWYGVPVYSAEDHKTSKLVTIDIYTSFYFPGLNDNAHWDPVQNYLSLGTGGGGYFPFTTLDVLAHELSHAFTSQHANLTYTGATGAMNEAFSDMAGQAVQFYLTGKNDWRPGKAVIADPTVVNCISTNDCALRYMDDPTKDGHSLDNVNNVTGVDEVHYASGIFNKFFYLLATQPNWNTRKVFDILVRANEYYWISGDGTARNYKPLACGIIAATKDYASVDSSYDVASVLYALKGVGYTDDGRSPQAPHYFDFDLKDCE